jgi:hypothetical protein
MLTVKQISTLKKSNVSIDAEKTKVRVPETFKGITAAQKREILELSGLLTGNSFYNIARSGSISSRAVLALAQVSGISPLYLTGESDSKEPCNDLVLDDFFLKCQGRGKKTKEKAPKSDKETVKVSRKQHISKKTEPATVSEKPKIKAVAVFAKPKKPVSIDTNSAIKLLEAMAIRAKYDKEAADVYATVKKILIK